MRAREVVLAEPTSNPTVMRFRLGGRAERLRPADAVPLAAELAALEGVARVLLASGGDAVLVQKSEAADWRPLCTRIALLLEERLRAAARQARARQSAPEDQALAARSWALRLQRWLCALRGETPEGDCAAPAAPGPSSGADSERGARS